METQKLSRMHPTVIWPLLSCHTGSGELAGAGKTAGAVAEELSVFPSLVKRKLLPKTFCYSLLLQGALGMHVAAFVWCRIAGLSAVRDRMSSKGLCLSNPVLSTRIGETT